MTHDEPEYISDLDQIKPYVRIMLNYGSFPKEFECAGRVGDAVLIINRAGNFPLLMSIQEIEMRGFTISEVNPYRADVLPDDAIPVEATPQKSFLKRLFSL